MAYLLAHYGAGTPTSKWPSFNVDGARVNGVHLWLAIRWFVGARYQDDAREAFWRWEHLDREYALGFDAAMHLFYGLFARTQHTNIVRSNLTSGLMKHMEAYLTSVQGVASVVLKDVKPQKTDRWPESFNIFKWANVDKLASGRPFDDRATGANVLIFDPKRNG